jgi:Xaa-Pro aminopeptidase
VGINSVQVGAPYNTMHQKVSRFLTEGLIDLGLLKGSVDECLEKETFKTFFMHGTGHWLGMDVHDAGAYKIQDDWRPLQPGMVLTIEPGLYIKENTPGVDPRWWNIGIRIEDDVVVTDKDPDVLTKLVPKEMADIEALMRA